MLPKDCFPKAVCVLCYNEEEDKILAVSRKNDPNAFGLPGGKIEKDESSFDAACRELLEETGFEVCSLKKIYEGPCGSTIPGGRTYWVETWEAIGYGISLSQEPAEGETGVVSWVDIEVLLDGPFGKFNEELFVAIGMLEWNYDKFREEE